MLENCMSFHHMGLAVRQDGPATTFLQKLGYEIGEKIYDPLQNVQLRMCLHAKEPNIELVMPGEGECPLTPILADNDEMIYHSCYEVSELDEVLDALDDAGLRAIPIVLPKPAVLFGGRMVSFYRIPGIGVIELLEP